MNLAARALTLRHSSLTCWHLRCGTHANAFFMVDKTSSPQRIDVVPQVGKTLPMHHLHSKYEPWKHFFSMAAPAYDAPGGPAFPDAFLTWGKKTN